MGHIYTYSYQTICEISGKSYIGVHATNNINDGYIGCGIFRQSSAKKNYLFHKAVRKHGYNSFTRHILSFWDTYEDALAEEKYLVDKKWVSDSGNYNTAIGGNGNTTSWMDFEDIVRIKKLIGDSNRGRVHSKDTIKKRINSRSWYRHSQETKDKISAIHKGKKLSAAHILDLSIKRSIALTGKPRSLETKIKLSISHKGKVLSDSHKKKLSDSHIGIQSKQRKPIIQINREGEFVNEFQSIAEASKILGVLTTSISNNLVGLSKSCSGYVFKYKKESSWT
jgi:hypothetical protein